MTRGLNVFVNIGGKLLPSLASAGRGAERVIDRLARRSRLANAEMKASFAGMERNFSRFNQHVSMPAALLAGIGARAAFEWSKVGNELQAVTQMSDDARKKIEAVARAMPGNPADNLSAALDLARTGFDEKAIMGSLGVTIKLGRADSSVDQAEAADIMTNVLKGMKMPEGSIAEVQRSAERVANNLAFAAAKSSSDVRLMGESFKYAAPLASRLGISIEDLSAYFMTMADAGIKGSESGVAFRSGMVRLLKPTKAAMAVLAKYNMSLDDYVTFSSKPTGASVVASLKAQGIAADGAMGKIQALLSSDVSGSELTQKISEAVAAGMDGGADAMDLDKISDGVTAAITSGADKVDFAKFLADAQKKGWSTGDLVRFFDTRQGARIATLFGSDFVKNLEKVKAAMRGMSGKGSFLDKMYALQMQGAVAPWEKLKQGFGNVFIAMAESGVLDTVASGLNKIANGLMSLSKANPQVLKFATYAILAAAVMAPLGFALTGIMATIGLLSPLLLGLGGIFVRIAPLLLTGLSRFLGPALIHGLYALAPMILRGLVMAFAFLSNPFGWAAILVGCAAALIWYFRDDLARAWPAVKAWFVNAFTGVKNYILSINWRGIGMSIADGLTGGLASKITAGRWGAIARGASMGMAVGGLPGAAMGVGAALAGKRARGGGTRGGSSYLVGEEGPEIFTPGASGYVSTNAKLQNLFGSKAGGARFGDVHFHINGALSPADTAREVQRALRKIAAGQRGVLSD